MGKQVLYLWPISWVIQNIYYVFNSTNDVMDHQNNHFHWIKGRRQWMLQNTNSYPRFIWTIQKIRLYHKQHLTLPWQLPLGRGILRPMSDTAVHIEVALPILKVIVLWKHPPGLTRYRCNTIDDKGNISSINIIQYHNIHSFIIVQFTSSI